MREDLFDVLHIYDSRSVHSFEHSFIELLQKFFHGASHVLATFDKPFQKDGGLKLLKGNLGKAIIKVSAVEPKFRVIEAPARVFTEQEEVKAAFEAGELFQDVIVVVRFQGPSANGMPELHKMTPFLGASQDRGHKVALVTDGRMSGASGKVPAAIHLSPEAMAGGLISKVQDGDIVRLDAEKGELELMVSAAELESRTNAPFPARTENLGRPIFSRFRETVGIAEKGAAAVNPMDIN